MLPFSSSGLCHSGRRAADALKLTAKHALAFGLVDEVLQEPLGGAHRDPVAMASLLKKALAKNLSSLGKLSPEELVQARYDKFRCMGRWNEPSLAVDAFADPATPLTPHEPHD